LITADPRTNSVLIGGPVPEGAAEVAIRQIDIVARQTR
jgi:hypothetical protein